eukprot:Rmarinus@m.27237
MNFLIFVIILCGISPYAVAEDETLSMDEFVDLFWNNTSLAFFHSVTTMSEESLLDLLADSKPGNDAGESLDEGAFINRFGEHNYIGWLDYDYSNKYGYLNLTEGANYPPVVGGSGWAMLFDGSTDTLSGQIQNWPERDITVAFWLQSSEISPFHNPVAFSTSDLGNAFSVNSETITDILINGDSASRVSEYWSTFIAVPGHWFHVAATVSSETGDVTVFINGAKHHTQYGCFPDFKVSTRGTLVIGQDMDINENSFEMYQAFAGMIDEFVVFPRVLEESEVYHLFATNTFPTGLSPSAYYTFDDGVVDRVDDDSQYEQDLQALGRTADDLRTTMFSESAYSGNVDGWSSGSFIPGYGPTWVRSTIPSAGGRPLVVTVASSGVSNIRLLAEDPNGDNVTVSIQGPSPKGRLYYQDGALRVRIPSLAEGEEFVLPMSVSNSVTVFYQPGRNVDESYTADFRANYTSEIFGEWDMKIYENRLYTEFQYCAMDTKKRICL